MFLQLNGDRPDVQRCEAFYANLRDDDAFDVKVGDFTKKSLKTHKFIDRRRDFKSRRRREADRNVKADDYGKATQALLKVDKKVSLEGATDVVMESSPPRKLSYLNEIHINDLSSYVDDPESGQCTSEAIVLQQVKRLKRSRSPRQLNI